MPLFFNFRWTKKRNKVLEKVNNSINKEFDAKPVYNEKYLKIKKESYGDIINANFHDKELPKERFRCIYLSLIMGLISWCENLVERQSFCRVSNKLRKTLWKLCFSTTSTQGNQLKFWYFMQWYKYVVKEKKKNTYVNDDLEVSYNKSDDFNMKRVLMCTL